MLLTDLKCKNLKSTLKAYKIADGGGLYLEVMPNNSKYWRLKYRFSGKEKRLALGVYPTISLSEARERRDQAKKLLSNQIDPSCAKRENKLKQKLESQNSFELIAKEWHETKLLGWTKHHAKNVLRRLELDIFPPLGAKVINDITAPELLLALRDIETRGALDIAHRALQTCGQIFRYAVATGRATRDISSDLRGALKTRKKEHYARLEAKELPEFLKLLDKYNGELQTKLALRFLILTFVRTGELRGARWSEMDLDQRQWRIPAHRMKMRDQHIVPLSDQAINILTKLKATNNGNDLVFPSSNKPLTCISENTMIYAVYRLGYHSRTTVHGFRATASTILNEHGFKADVIERQLAHTERNSVRASYNHAEYLPERRDMMQWWANYLEEQMKA